MFKYLPLALLASSPLLGDMCCMPLEDPKCYTYAVNPPVSAGDCCNFGGRIDFLYWRPHSDDNSFATVQNAGYYGQGSVVPVRPSQFAVSQVDTPYDWQAGFRIGVDAGVPCNEWRVELDWTHYLHHTPNKFVGVSHPSGPNTSTVNPVATLSYLQDPTFYQSFSQITIPLAPSLIVDSSATGQWKIDYNTLDLVFKRQFYVGHLVTLTPYGGLKALFLRQTLNSSANATYSLIDPDILGVIGQVSSNISANLCSDFKGVGIQAGFGSTWELFCDLSFYSDISSSVLYGKSQSRLKGILNSSLFPTTSFTTIGTPTIVSYFAERNVDTLKTTLDVAFGIEWATNLFSDCSFFVLRAGWEEHILFRQNTFIEMDVTYETVQVANSSIKQRLTDVTFQGLVITAILQY